MEKFCPAAIPVRGLLPLFPERRISTEPSLSVRIEQLANRFCEQLMASAGTPFSISLSEVQFLPDALVKNSTPCPFSGTVKLKFIPTFVQPPGGQLRAVPPPSTPRMMILGSLMPSAKANPVHSSAR